MRARSLYPPAAAALILAAGWGTMDLWWVLAQPTNLRGLYDYWSSTLGDGIVLPVIAYSLARMGDLLPPRQTRLEMLTGAIMGATVGIAITVSWLADTEPSPNWTLPRAGHFTAAGWYHAAFMIATLTWFTASFVDRIARLHKSASPHADATLHPLGGRTCFRDL